jgi:hypothetical protein
LGYTRRVLVPRAVSLVDGTGVEPAGALPSNGRAPSAFEAAHKREKASRHPREALSLTHHQPLAGYLRYDTCGR